MNDAIQGLAHDRIVRRLAMRRISCGRRTDPIADGGFSKADAKRFLQERATLPLFKYSQENIERRFLVTFKERSANATEETAVPAVQRAEDIIIAVIGGAGKHSAYIPTFGATKSVTRALTRKDGSLARSIKDFKP